MVIEPTPDIIREANLSQFMSRVGTQTVRDFHQWTIAHYQHFWSQVIETLNIRFKTQPKQICDLSRGVEYPDWLPGAQLNIVDSCLMAPPHQPAILCQHDESGIHTVTYQALDALSNRIANSLIQHHCKPGEAIAIIMPMHHWAVALYLAILKIGAVVVSIADSFSYQEIKTRLDIAKTKLVFTQQVAYWCQKPLLLYDKILQANAPDTIILSLNENDSMLPKRAQDKTWEQFLIGSETFQTTACHPMQPCNVLFSSGTTATPKAIPWNHITPIKAASDAYFHHNIKPGDTFAWPTNLGWMMGPWLIFATLMNQATLALYTETPKTKAFGEFIEKTKTTLLGVVPTLVAGWRQSKCMETLNWQTIKIFSSTGECSNESDMSYLMQLGGGKPIIEYCGGTEIGGAYLSSTVIEKNYPTLFSTPAMGMNMIIIDEAGKPARTGEVALIPPSIGLSTVLLNKNHHQIYFEGIPQGPHGECLRRHGDAIRQLENGYYCLLGRTDDTMNLGGIKIGAAEIERTLIGIPDVIETAAVDHPNTHGLSQLVIYAVVTPTCHRATTTKRIQMQIKTALNPLFKVDEVIYVDALPKTASNKIIRRALKAH